MLGNPQRSDRESLTLAGNELFATARARQVLPIDALVILWLALTIRVTSTPTAVKGRRNVPRQPVLGIAIAVVPAIALGGVLKNFISGFLETRCVGIKNEIISKLGPLRAGI